MLSGNRVSICAVAGMGGVGKTELATQYARTHEADYPGGICWLNARDTHLAAEIIQFAQLYLNLEVPQELGGRRLNLEEQVAWCWQRWQPPEGQVLVVLDDVTDLGSCRKVLPRANRFRVLMTTRLRRIDTNFVELSLDVLSQEAALELLAALVGEKRVGLTSPPAPLLRGEGSKKIAVSPSSTSPSSLSPPFPRREGGMGGLGSSDALQLCEWLGYLPLGLELVGRYLAEDPDLSLAEILERLKAQRLQNEAIDLDEQQLQDTEMTAKRGVRAAFELSWQELDPVTQRVAQYLSLFASTVFLWEWVESETELLNCSKTDINAAKKQLYKRHLIGRVEEREGRYKIHPLIREFLQAKLTASEQAKEFKRAFGQRMVAIAKEIPYSHALTVTDIASVKDAIPHLEEVAQTLVLARKREDLVLNLIDMDWPFIGLCRYYEGQGLYALAESWHQQVLELHKHHLGENNPLLETSLHNQAVLYYSQGRYSEAEPLFVQALELRKCLLGEDHPLLADSLNNLAQLYESQGRYSEAEPLNVQALELRKRHLGENNPDVAQSLNNLAALYLSQGRYSEAEPLFVQALELCKRHLGEDHPLLADSLNNLAALYYSQGRYREAEPLFVQALELCKRHRAEDHPDVAQSINNLAALYYSQGRYREAEPFAVQALELSERVLGVGHPDSVLYRKNLALLRDEITDTIQTQQVKSQHRVGFGSQHLRSNLNQPLKKAKDKRKRKRRD